MKRQTRFKLFKRRIKYFWQRVTRGWDDSDTWSMDSTFADLILPRLKRFKDIKGGHPASITSEEWDTILQSMIETFEFYGSERRFDCDAEEFDKAQVGLDLFAKWYPHLWW